jgi:glycosyltransferase involved in cell wall biosynthesis
MKICLYSPYVPKHIGGGERYMFDVALALAKQHQVFFAVAESAFTSATEIAQKYEAFLGESLSSITFIPGPIGTNHSFFSKLWWTKQWDVLYYLTDGSLFFSLAKKNILHIQFPFKLNKRSPIEQLKLANWQVKNTNSTFTKSIVEPNWPVSITLVHQPQIQSAVQASELNSVLKKKEKVILHVGRFFKQLHSKRQDVLVEIFAELIKKHPKVVAGWKLVLIGNVEDQAYAKEVAKLAQGMPVEIIHELSRAELLKWYAKATIYWHATGYGVDQAQNPEKVEHFGISTGEAMSFGCAPVVINKGGQPEVLGEELADLLWDNQLECVDITRQLIADPAKLLTAQHAAHRSILRFSPELFEQKLNQMLAYGQ